MPFDTSDFDWRDHPEPRRGRRWELLNKLNSLLHRLVLYLVRAIFVGVLLLLVACLVVLATGHRPECVIIDPFGACR